MNYLNLGVTVVSLIVFSLLVVVVAYHFTTTNKKIVFFISKHKVALISSLSVFLVLFLLAAMFFIPTAIPEQGTTTPTATKEPTVLIVSGYPTATQVTTPNVQSSPTLTPTVQSTPTLKPTPTKENMGIVVHSTFENNTWGNWACYGEADIQTIQNAGETVPVLVLKSTKEQLCYYEITLKANIRYKFVANVASKSTFIQINKDNKALCNSNSATDPTLFVGLFCYYKPTETQVVELQINKVTYDSALIADIYLYEVY